MTMLLGQFNFGVVYVVSLLVWTLNSNGLMLVEDSHLSFPARRQVERVVLLLFFHRYEPIYF